MVFKAYDSDPTRLWIEEMYDTQVQEVEQVFTGRTQAEPLVGALKLDRGTAVIEARRTYFMTDGSIGLIALTIHPADRFRHSMVLKRARG